MKTIIFILFCMLSVSDSYGQMVCRIFYDYDAAGNRVKRYYKCYDPNIPDEYHPGDWLVAVLYPNPTYGPITVSFDELVDHATLSVSGMSGQVLTAAECSNCYEINCDLAQFTPGTYIINLEASSAQYTDKHIESFTVVKLDQDVQ